MRLGFYEDQKAGTAAYAVFRDWDGSGIELRVPRVGPGTTPGTMISITPGIGTSAYWATRTDILLIPNLRVRVTDVGTWGSDWIVVNGALVPDGPIYHNATPEAAVTAPVGSLCVRTTGGAVTTLYVKESGTGNTGWVAK